MSVSINRLISLFALLCLFFPCVSFSQEQLSALDVEQPEGWDEDLVMAQPFDINPDPNILEFELEAKITDIEIEEGFMTPVWTYGGTLPGPLIKAKVGDTIIVHFKNSLPESTSIHWHGLRVPNGMDGVPGVTQPPIEPGEEFRYEFTVNDAGTYWYHPHINSTNQVGWGMYGGFVVEDPADPEVFGDDLVLLISDISIDFDGSFLPANNGGGFSRLFGREGRVLLVNGKVLPRLKVRKGKQQRWRVINAARSRYVRMSLRDHYLMRLGGDNGLAAYSEEVPRIIITPGERADFVFTPSNDPGVEKIMRWGAVNRGFGTTDYRPPVNMLIIETVDEAPVIPAIIPRELRVIQPLDVSNAVEKELEMTIELGGKDEVTMGFNGIPYWNMSPLEARVGETHVWTLVNHSDFNHPFHLHGYFFQVLDENRAPEWKDTVDVPVGTELKIAIRFEGRPGMWMYHCHILDHAEVGMMGQLLVREALEP
ncbi:MAG: oxidoreductase [SAR86 cluster bacterium]|uniref:Oxidoreductase n=1 Tax=SAR86 cluster bacterium TaxID=2030880 RepID=A0A2A5CDE3_9GAMM|nr:MAG: oxidoreductase [SAR86 cluster bacterium]